MKRLDGRRRWQAVERHVHERRHAAGSRGTGRVIEALPVGPTGIVDVDVRVDEAGKDDQIPGIQLAHASGTAVVWGDLDDLSVADVNGRGPHPVGQDDARAADDQGHVGIKRHVA